MRILARLTLALVLAATWSSARAQPVADLPGSWKMSGGNVPALGLLHEKTDLHFYFLFGLSKEFEKVRLLEFTLEEDPKLYVDALTAVACS